MRQIYVGCSLTQSSDKFRAFVFSFKAKLAKAVPCTVLEFKGLTEGSNADVFEHDLNNVRTSDALIFIVDYPAIGLGMEIGEAIVLKKPILCLHAKDASVTRMLRGASELGRVRMDTYEDEVDAVSKAANFVAKL
ncbi:MAG: hypothetical protein JO019_00285 [Candidatus Kaiserbacteria bacterium]|nr:hypothetical protein [Candidatus Kaiserbacteria bacterium]